MDISLTTPICASTYTGIDFSISEHRHFVEDQLNSLAQRYRDDERWRHDALLEMGKDLGEHWKVVYTEAYIATGGPRFMFVLTWVYDAAVAHAKEFLVQLDDHFDQYRNLSECSHGELTSSVLRFIRSNAYIISNHIDPEVSDFLLHYAGTRTGFSLGEEAECVVKAIRQFVELADSPINEGSHFNDVIKRLERISEYA